MATNPWAVANNPAGSSSASNADDDIRKVRLDIQERMIELGVDWLADPVVFDQEKHVFLHWSHFTTLNPTFFSISSNAFQKNGAGAGTIYGWLPLLRGVALEHLAIEGETGTGSSLTLHVKRVDIAAGVASVTTVTTLTVPENSTLGTHSKAIDPAHDTEEDPAVIRFYYLELLLSLSGTPCRFYGVHLRYQTTKLAGAL